MSIQRCLWRRIYQATDIEVYLCPDFEQTQRVETRHAQPTGINQPPAGGNKAQLYPSFLSRRYANGNRFVPGKCEDQIFTQTFTRLMKYQFNR